ncbi:MAG: poly-beta-1,6 N-acetyl-D-glucosamine synthase [Rhodospirillaceae bacterium]|nr:poly-beta-1,6 N-acetyl-D-glucosamine synthase [Rhodospirillales bacterium]
MIADFLLWFGSVLLEFVFLYPLYMTLIWLSGGLYYYWKREHGRPGPNAYPAQDRLPFVSILVPCFNEGDNVRETIGALLEQNYPDFEVIAINDGSRDDTGAQLDALLAIHDRLRVIQLAANQGKAMALRMGALAAKGEVLVCIDGDAVLSPNTTAWLASHFVDNPRVGAVTGNPRIRTRSTMLGRLQVGEFSSIIGLIKRAQRVYGRVFTVSGVIVAFRKAALHRVGYWSIDMITEDIDISWKLQLDHWSVLYEPNALCWILMPETLKGLWRQRLRWAQGGAEVFLKYASHMGQWRARRMWPILGEYMLSVAWAYSFVLCLGLWALGLVMDLPAQINVPTILPPAFWGLLLATVCLAQIAVSLKIESRYETGLMRWFGWMIWYPMAFWLLVTATTVVALPKAILKKRGKRAVWVSPDRGVRQQ